MIKLESNFNNSFDATFYFKTMKECEEFLYVFKDHWCNVPWKKPVEVSDDIKISEYKRNDLNNSPKERAESNLSWGFSNCRFHNIGINNTQSAFVNNFISKQNL